MKALRELAGTAVWTSLKRFAADLKGVRKRSSSSPRLLFCLDQPEAALFETAGTVAVSGWILAQEGVESVELSIDGELVTRAKIDVLRPDVAAVHPDFPEPVKSGFSEVLDVGELQVGDHSLQVLFRDRAGKSATVERCFRRIESDLHYHRLLLAALPTEREVDATHRALLETGSRPSFEWWVEAGDLSLLERTLESIASQRRVDWRCFVVAPRGRWSAVEDAVSAAVKNGAPERFSCRERFEPRPGSDCQAKFIGLLSQGEELMPHALLRWALELAESRAELSYADSDQIKPGRLHCEPNFKPDWSPDYALSRNFVGGVFLARMREEVTELIRSHADRSNPAWRYGLWLRLTEQVSSVHHVPQVLWSEPFREEVARQVTDAELEAVRSALRRRNREARVESQGEGPLRRVRWPMPEPPPLVSIVVPTTGRLDLVKPCVESIQSTTRYEPYELVFVDNSRGKSREGIAYLRKRGVTLVEHSEDFNWASLCNVGATAARGEMLLFFNDDMEAVEEDWLGELVALASRPEIGGVGALLLYPDGRIQHAGVFLVDHGGGARHFLQFLDPSKKVYQSLQKVVREVSANTGACLMMRRSIFEEVGGFDEDLAVVGNDVDICLRLSSAGYRHLWTPFSRIVHHESVSRKHISIDRDEGKMWERWEAELRRGDPFYSPNLTQTKSNCELNSELEKRIFLSELSARANAETRAVPGVNLIGYIRAEMGVGEAARSIARALEAASVPFGLINYESGNPSRMGDDSWAHRVVGEPEHPVTVLHINADLTPDAMRRLPADCFKGRYTIGYWVWELPEFPNRWISSFSHVDEVWVPSSFVQEVISRKSPVPVTRIPHSIDKPSAFYLDRAYFGLSASRFLFLVMYDLHSVPERKNPEGAIEAFRKAFSRANRDVGLAIKVNNASESELRRLREVTQDYPAIQILDSVMSRHEVDSLIHSCDCFVSLHRAEGFGLVIAEAMALGTPVIATAWSGNCDYMDANNAACVGYELEQLSRNLGPYEKGQRWALPDLEEASWWMRRLAAEPCLARELGEKARADIESRLSPVVVGRLIRERLARIGGLSITRSATVSRPAPRGS